MRDHKQWAIAYAQLDALRKNIPAWIDEGEVHRYHSVLDSLAAASGEDLAAFHIPTTELKPKVNSWRMGTRRAPAEVNYSEKNYCDDDYFKRQVQGVWQYIQTLEGRKDEANHVNGPKDYWAMNDTELERHANKYHIPPWTRTGANLEHWFVDRDRIIDSLLKRDAAHRAGNPAPSSNVVHVENMYGSSIQQGTQGSNVTINFKANESDLRSVLAKIKNSVDGIELSPAAKGQLTVDIGTVEVQLSSPNPRSSIITECLQSMKTILENAAGSLLASGFVVEVNKFLGG